VGGSDGAAELAVDPAGAVAGADGPTLGDEPPGALGEAAPGALDEVAADALGEVVALDAAVPGTPGDWGNDPAALGACDGAATPGDEAMAPGI